MKNYLILIPGRKFCLISYLLCLYTYVVACDCSLRTLDEIINESKTIVFGKVLRQESKWMKIGYVNFALAPDTTCYYSLEGIRSNNKEIHYCSEVTVYYIQTEKYYKSEIYRDTILLYSLKNSNCRISLTNGMSYMFCMNKEDMKDINGLEIFGGISSCTKIIPNKPDPNDEKSVKAIEEFSYIEDRFKR